MVAAESIGVDDRRRQRLEAMAARLDPSERIALANILRAKVDISGRAGPHNLEAEAAVLSAVYTYARTFDEILDILPNGSAFYDDANRRWYDVAVELHHRGVPVDLQTVYDVMKQRDQLQAAGGLEHLSRLIDASPAVANVAAHARIVAEKARIRRLIETCLMIAAEAHGDYGIAPEFIGEAVEKVSSIAEGGHSTRIQSIDEIGRERDAELAEQWEGKRDPWGMRGPHERLHALMHGYGISEQTYVAADTGGGKSAFALQVLLDLAGRTYAHERIGCAYISLEMRSKRHYDRAILHEAHALAVERHIEPVTMHELMTGCVEGSRDERLAYDKIAIIEEARRVVRAKPVDFEDSDHDIVKLRTTLRQMQRRMRERGAVLRFVVLDHMHIMTFPDSETEAAALAEMVKGFNDIAKDLEVHMMPLAQFGTKTETRDVPVLNDIRGASAIRQIAHKAILLHRPWTRMSLKQKREASEDEKREATAILAKHRDGREGVVPMTFIGGAFRFNESNDVND